MFLAKLTRYNARMLVVDETKEDYSATTAPYPAAKYPTFYKDIDITTSQPPHNFHSQWRNGEIIPSLTRNTTNFSGNSFDPYGDYQELSPQHGVQYSRDVNKFTHLHDRVKRSELLRSHMRQIRESEFKKNFTGEVNLKRSKRQNGGLGSDELCQSRSTFVMPRAALNKNGVWMYVVNMENDNQKYTQLVKSEVCISQTCSSICGLPNGYTSKCEQKYVQKRLIALQGQGDQLYTDLFWIPSCCICTIQRN
ncbi:hypothetical protein WA026_000886 [Henosepilachna vigintioctopunctata]|uniref:Spaetzle domain-containing protein n=1 Tax=Henosepilachna vigintioctopunctata TaxID=420089 RepID=A0AAW1UZ33_9CUCU